MTAKMTATKVEAGELTGTITDTDVGQVPSDGMVNVRPRENCSFPAYTGEVIDEWKNTIDPSNQITETKYVHGGPQE